MSASQMLSYQLTGQTVPEFKVDPQQLKNYQSARDDLARIKAKLRAGQATQHDKDLVKQITSKMQTIGEQGEFWRPEELRTKKEKEPEKKVVGAMTAKKAAKQFGSDIGVYMHPDGYSYIDTPSGRIIIIK